MPLSTPTISRTPQHIRQVHYRSFERADGLWDIEGELLDTKAVDVPFVNREGIRRAGEPIHHMWIRATVNTALVVQSIEAVMDAHPLGGCPAALAGMQKMVGCCMARGWRKSIEANLGYPTTGKARLTDPRLAGGALLDVGVYPLNFIDMVMGGRPVARIDTTMSAYSTGVDAQNSMTLWYEDGTMAVATSSMTSVTDRIGSVRGTDGYILCRNINNVESIEVFDGSHQLVSTHAIPAQLTGYEYEVASTATALRAHAIECPEMPHADTLRMMELMDDIRERWGLRYPGE